jgi:hypothetical protein
VNLLWQAIGLAVCIAAGLAVGGLVAAFFDRRGGLTEIEDVQVAGNDATYWEIIHDLEPPLVTTGNGEGAVVGTPGDGERTPSDIRTTPPGP